MILFCSSFPH